MTFAFRFILSLVLLVSVLPTAVQAKTLAETLSGRILLQVQSHGEAWYIDPVSLQRFFLGRAEDAYALMRAKGLGIRHAELQRYLGSRFPARLSGRIVLDVEARGQAYYIIPSTLRGVYLGRAEDAYALMRRYGLGITNQHLAQISPAPQPLSPVVSVVPPITSPPGSTPYHQIERSTFDQINAYRQSKGLRTLVWNEDVASVARTHSEEMSSGRIEFGHTGFTERAKTLQQKLRLTGLAENVAYNDYPDPARTSVDGWIASDGHRINIENDAYTVSGMGVTRSPDGAYYFTQLFVAQ